MSLEEKNQEEIDKATSLLTVSHYIDWFAELQKIKYATNRDKVIDEALKLREIILKIWNVNVDELKEAGELLKHEDGECLRDFEDKSYDDMEIPPFLLPNLIDWMRNKGISDTDIVDCIQYICATHPERN
ncbi:MAG: hypothetical protein HDT39_06005 [Lachnospiraceae bacterium]|nr:hypothetical protein [Lachnospiraceae bacterium]